MTEQSIKALSDSELIDVVAWAQAEQKTRAEKRKQETIAKIRELAGSVGVAVRIDGTRGRPPKARESKPEKA
jgi:hypothetical protein